MAAPRFPQLVAALGAGDAAVTEAAARALSHFNLLPCKLAEAGGIAPLVEVVRLGSEGAKEHAARALRSPAMASSISMVRSLSTRAAAWSDSATRWVLRV